MEISFEQLPKAVNELSIKLDRIEKLLSKEKENQPESDYLLTIKQAAEFLSLAVPTIYGLVSRAAIPVSKKGKRLYFSKQELTEWVKSGRRKTPDESAAEVDQYLSRRAK